MTYKQIENQYWETFDINQGTDKINGYPVIKISDTYSRPATVEDFESFLKQSFIKYLKDECERLSKHEKVCLDECQLDSTGDCNCGMLAYNQAIDDQITHITNQIRELEV